MWYCHCFCSCQKKLTNILLMLTLGTKIRATEEQKIIVNLIVFVQLFKSTK